MFDPKLLSVCYDQSEPISRFAGEELIKYLCALSDTAPDYRFVLRNDENLADEEIFISIHGKEVTLAGGGRGLLYAVYEFLERYAGCSFGAQRHPEVTLGEYVPHLPVLTLPEGEYSHKPSLPYRTAIVQFSVWAGEADRGLTLPFFDWLAKNRYNRILTWVSCYEKLKQLGLLPELEKRGIRLTVGHHQSIFTFLPPYGNQYFPTHYRKEHPEYFRLSEDGGRFEPVSPTKYNGQWLLCARNSEAVRTVGDNILQWLSDNPLVDTVAFWPNDGEDPDCCCLACAAHSKTENYLYFENELAKHVAKQRPDVKIDTLIYMDLWKKPEGLTLCDNIVIDQATWDVLPRTCGKRDGGSIVGTHYEQNLLDYRACGKHAVFYDYYMGNYGNRQKLMPAADEMQSIFSAMRQKGLDGSGTQMECFNHWNNLFNFYCFARTAYDTDLDCKAQLERFIRLFGKGGEQISEILLTYETVLEGQVSIAHSGNYFLEHVDKERIYSLFEQALSAAETPLARNNIRMMRLAFRYSDLAVTDPDRDAKGHPVTLADPTGELGYMATHFDSFFANHTGLGIAFPITNRSDAPAPNDWYIFE